MSNFNGQREGQERRLTLVQADFEETKRDIARGQRKAEIVFCWVLVLTGGVLLFGCWCVYFCCWCVYHVLKAKGLVP